MTVHSRRALRVTATLAGAAALAASFSGTAAATENDEVEQDNSVRNSTHDYAEESPGDDAEPSDLGIGPVSNLDLLGFELPTSGGSMVPVKKDDDDDRSNPRGSKPNHYHPGASEMYDFDLYSPTETYGANGCEDTGADRAPIWATAGGFGGYNGDSARDCKVDSGDYKPKKTGYQGGKDKSNGYNGYLGSDPAKQSGNDFLFALPGS